MTTIPSAIARRCQVSPVTGVMFSGGRGLPARTARAAYASDMRIALLAGLACLAFATTGCGERAVPGSGELVPDPVEVRGAGTDPTRLDELPRRIVVLGPGAAEI